MSECPWGAITVPTEAHSTRKGQPPRMHGSALWEYGQKGQRGPYFHRAEGTATSGAQDVAANIEHWECFLTVHSTKGAL